MPMDKFEPNIVEMLLGDSQHFIFLFIQKYNTWLPDQLYFQIGWMIMIYDLTKPDGQMIIIHDETRRSNDYNP